MVCCCRCGRAKITLSEILGVSRAPSGLRELVSIQVEREAPLLSNANIGRLRCNASQAIDDDLRDILTLLINDRVVHACQNGLLVRRIHFFTAVSQHDRNAVLLSIARNRALDLLIDVVIGLRFSLKEFLLLQLSVDLHLSRFVGDASLFFDEVRGAWLELARSQCLLSLLKLFMTLAKASLEGLDFTLHLVHGGFEAGVGLENFVHVDDCHRTNGTSLLSRCGTGRDLRRRTRLVLGPCCLLLSFNAC